MKADDAVAGGRLEGRNARDVRLLVATPGISDRSGTHWPRPKLSVVWLESTSSREWTMCGAESPHQGNFPPL